MNNAAPFNETAFLAKNHEGVDCVSIHVKATYQLLPNGFCRRADYQQPFLATGEGVDESDIIPFKNATDLILMASAHAGVSRKVNEMMASIEIGKIKREYRVIGERKCIYQGRGSLRFSNAAPFEFCPLTHALAYGGFDPTVPAPEIRKLADTLAIHPGLYPRNPVGLGYVVYENPERLDGLVLPNVEQPERPLTPENLIVGNPARWWQQPIPWAPDWFGKTWYPRMTFYGGVPDGIPDDDREVPEVKLGWIAPHQNRRAKEPDFAMINRSLGNAAAPALVLPFMRGDEAIRLRGVNSTGEIVVQLPGDPPQIKVRFEGRTFDVRPVPNRILISTMEMGVYIIWHGAWKTPRTLPDRLLRPGENPLAVDMEGIDVFVNNRKLSLPVVGS